MSTEVPAFLSWTDKERLAAKIESHKRSIGMATLREWNRRLQPWHRINPVRYWQERFRMVGQFTAQIEGEIDYHVNPMWENYLSLDLAPEPLQPPRLFLAATEEKKWQWNWVDSFALAKEIADMHGGGTKIWACDPGEVFGWFEVKRWEPQIRPERPKLSRTWRTWIVHPERVWEVPRWRDPTAAIPTDATWEGRGVTQEEANSIVGSWVRQNDLSKSPLDRESDLFWIDAFDKIGQFDAVHSLSEDGVGTTAVDPATGMKLPEVLYRGAGEELSTRWSWTDSLEMAERYARTFAKDGKVWCCIPRKVFGKVRFNPPEVRHSVDFPAHNEWLLIPEQVWLASRPQDDPRNQKDRSDDPDFWK